MFEFPAGSAKRPPSMLSLRVVSSLPLEKADVSVKPPRKILFVLCILTRSKYPRNTTFTFHNTINGVHVTYTPSAKEIVIDQGVCCIEYALKLKKKLVGML